MEVIQFIFASWWICLVGTFWETNIIHNLTEGISSAVNMLEVTNSTSPNSSTQAKSPWSSSLGRETDLHTPKQLNSSHLSQLHSSPLCTGSPLPKPTLDIPPTTSILTSQVPLPSQGMVLDLYQQLHPDNVPVAHCPTPAFYPPFTLQLGISWVLRTSWKLLKIDCETSVTLKKVCAQLWTLT